MGLLTILKERKSTLQKKIEEREFRGRAALEYSLLTPWPHKEIERYCKMLRIASGGRSVIDPSSEDAEKRIKEGILAVNMNEFSPEEYEELMSRIEASAQIEQEAQQKNIR